MYLCIWWCGWILCSSLEFFMWTKVSSMRVYYLYIWSEEGIFIVKGKKPCVVSVWIPTLMSYASISANMCSKRLCIQDVKCVFWVKKKIPRSHLGPARLFRVEACSFLWCAFWLDRVILTCPVTLHGKGTLCHVFRPHWRETHFYMCSMRN